MMEALVAEFHNHQTDISGMSKPETETAPEKVDTCSQPLAVGMSKPEPEPVSEKVDACSQPFAAGSKPHLFYKCLLNQHAQKLRKQLPVYQTHNEGFQHLPKFRSTVWIDGVSYTSSNTFQQRKMAEMDVSKIAYFAIMQKSKNEALQLIHKDKTFCKSILVEYAAKMNIENPKYETVHLETSVPAFRSSLLFNGVIYSGDNGKSKKEAEQLAARAVILKYLDSESGNDMSEIINCKFRLFGEMNKVPEMNNVHNETSVVGAEMGVDNAIGLNEAKADSGTYTMHKSSVGPEFGLVQGTTVSATCLSPVVTQPPIPKGSIQAIPPAVPGPAVSTQTPSAMINSSTSSVVSTLCLGKFTSIPTCLSSNVIQSPNLEASAGTIVSPLPLASQAVEHLPLMVQTSERKRNRKNKKNAQKKMRVEAQMPIPAVLTSPVPPCSSQ